MQHEQDLCALGADGERRLSFQQLSGEPGFPARVSAVQRGRLLLHDGRTEHGVPLRWPELVVGDWVHYDPASQDLHLLPRRTLLQRGRGAGAAAQPLVANVDCALLLMGLDGDYNLRRLERYLLLVRSAGIWPLVLLGKADACADAAHLLAQARRRVGASVEVHAVDNRDPQLRLLLQPWLAAPRTLVLLGSSGVGKSTLANTLLGHVRQDTGAVRAHDSRGRHTTTTRTLLQLPDGACLIDTPGLRAVGCSGDEDLAAGFDDIAGLARDCRFADCRHQGELGCAVSGQVAAERLRSYRKLEAELARQSSDPRLRQQRKQAEKQQHQALYRFLKARGR